MENYNTHNNKIIIRHACLSDLDGMAKCHIAAFPGQFMTQMGYCWLKGLYRYFIQHEKSISIVASNNSGEILGLAVGGDNDIRDEFLHKALLKYPHLLLWKFLTCGIVRKKLILELLTKLRFKNKNTIGKSQVNEVDCGVLLSIGVCPDWRGKGIADKIIEKFSNTAKKQYEKLRLTVHTDNTRAIGFYRRNNWYEVAKTEDCTKLHLDLNNS